MTERINKEKIFGYSAYFLMIVSAVGLVIMLDGDLRKEYSWTGNIYLFLQTVILFSYILNYFDKKKIIISAVIISLTGFAAEYIGLKTGFPFGTYTYGEILHPKLFGVPVIISLLWYSVSIISFILVSYYSERPEIVKIFSAAVLVLGYDILLEPFAAFVNDYWTWENGKIPLINYFSWFFISLLFVFYFSRVKLISVTGKEERTPLNIFNKLSKGNIPVTIFILNIIQFSVINGLFGFFSNLIIGLFIISIAFSIGRRFK